MCTQRLAFSTLACPDWTIEQAAEAARRLGYEGVQLRLVDGAFLQPDISALERSRIRSAFSGLQIACVDTSVRFSSSDEAERAGNRADAIKFLQLANDLESPLIRVFAGQPFEVAQGHELAVIVERVTDSLSQLRQKAEEYGVNIGVETHDVSATGRVMAQILSSVSSPAIGAIWDVWHPFRNGESPEATYEFLKGNILFVHVKDALKTGEKWLFTLLGEGTLPVREMLATLGKAGWNGWISVEWEKKWYPEIAEPDVVLPQYAEVLRRYLGGMTSIS